MLTFLACCTYWDLGLSYMSYAGPAGHYWYHSLDRIVGNFVTRGSMRFVIAKVLLY